MGEEQRRAPATGRTANRRSATRHMGGMFASIVTHPWAVLAVILVATCGFALHLDRLRMDPDVEAYVPKHHPVRTFWHKAEKDFMLRDEMLLALVADGKDGIYTPEILAGIADLTEKIRAQPAVFANDVHSLSQADAMVATDDALDVVPFYETPPTDAAGVEAVHKAVERNPVYLDRLVSRGGDVAVIQFRIDRDAAPLSETYANLLKMIAARPVPGARVLLTGKPAIEAVYARQMAEDLGRLIPLYMLVVLAVLFVCFRSLSIGTVVLRTGLLWAGLIVGQMLIGHVASWTGLGALALGLALLTARGVVTPTLVVVLALLWTWGLQAWLDAPIYVTSIIMPPLLLAIGCADGIHIYERYEEKIQEGLERPQAVVQAMRGIWRPVMLTSLTTAAGFASLAAVDMTAFQSLGLFSAFGILVAMVLSLVLIPALLALMPAPVVAPKQAITSRLLVRLGENVHRHRRAVIAAGGMVMAVALFFTLRVRVDYSWVESLQEGTPVLIADRELRHRHGGTTPLDIIVETSDAGGIKEPAVLRGMDATMTGLGEDPSVGDTRSLAEYVKRMNQAMNGDRADAYVIPASRNLVAQYLLLYSMAGDPGELDDMVDYDYRRANMVAHLRTDAMAKMDGVIERAEKLLDTYLRPLGVTATVTGSAMMQHTVLHLIFMGQVYSLLVATVLVFVILCLIYRSAVYALVCMLPPGVAALLTFGTMGASGIALGPNQAVISAIALGIGIDYSIHLISRIVAQTEGGADLEQAVGKTLATTGRGVFFNAAVVVAGFAILALSRSPSNISFGLLIAGNMAASCVAALVLVPAVLSELHERELLARFRLRDRVRGGLPHVGEGKEPGRRRPCGSDRDAA